MPPKKTEEKMSGAVRFGRCKNNLKFGVVGLPNVGKSSLFNLLTEQSVPSENFPFCTIDPNEAKCPVPDSRFDALCSFYKPISQICAALRVTDIAGLVRGASEGAGLGNAFLSHIQAVDGYFHVVRAFDSMDILHVDETVDPIRDMETISHELCQKDLSALEKAIKDEQLEVRKNPKLKITDLFNNTMKKIQELLNINKPIRDADWCNAEIDLICKKLQSLITTKPCVYLINISASDYIKNKNKWLKKIKIWIDEHGGGTIIPFSVELEELLYKKKKENALLDQDLLNVKSALPRMIKVAYRELGLIQFFTSSEKEVRCWTVLQGSTAPQAAGIIHSDFEKGFIKASVIGYEDWKEFGQAGLSSVKAAGKQRQEGKNYIMKDGDIVHFYFNTTTTQKK